MDYSDITNNVRAMIFDVYGTTVDWRKEVTSYLMEAASRALDSASASIPSQVRLLCDPGDAVFWSLFAQDWRESYYNYTRQHDPVGQIHSFVNTDTFYEHSLINLLERYGLVGLWNEQEIAEHCQIWHRLRPWPDSVIGLNFLRYKKGYRIATLSNADTALIQDLVEWGNLPFTDILSAEQFGVYKPHREIYERAARKLDIPFNQCAMVAAHLGDLEAAKEVGMWTVYVERWEEEMFNESQISRAKREGFVDMWIELTDSSDEEDGAAESGGFIELARRLGVHDHLAMETTSGLTGLYSEEDQ
ncbi:putative haloacid type ii [Phaeomoniella chlamydospora]|uniref:Putative haloacid type ii n=1 Tax=Phaeomoniella chlamydospora TaxID=158046 RepID=A0A0G2EZ35_PHACM|nr:putative haloacid type ii [Phaeomoniella chlamydospora]